MEHNKTISDLSANRKKGDIKHLRQVLAYMLRYKGALFGAAFALLVTSGSVLAIGKGLGFLVDYGFSSQNPDVFANALLVLLAISFVLAIGTFSRYYFITYVGERVVADIRNDVYAHILTLSPVFFEKNKIGEILSRITTDTTLLQVVVGSSVSVALRNAILLIGGILLLLFTSAKLIAYIAIVIPLVVAPIVIIGRKVRKLSRDSQDKVAVLSAHAEETLGNVKVVQSFNRQIYETGLFSGLVADSFMVAMKRVRMRAVLTAMVIFMVFAAIASVVYVGGLDVLSGTMSAGDLSSFLFYSLIVAAATGAISEVYSDLQRAAGAAERIFELLATTSKISEPSQPQVLPEKVKGRLHFKDVTFHYPSRPKESALDGFNLEVNPGETIALVGPSGSGKTTVFNLLLRFYEPQSGSVCLDGVEVGGLQLRDLREQFGVVPQDSVIFSGTVYDNIRFADPLATNDAVIQAAKDAAALEFIENLPNGFDTFLGEKGVRISGGQQQRIAIARAFLKNPKILLLDEATSALDAESERLIQQSLAKLCENRTTLIIAHRLSTVKKADRIVVMDQGRIEAIGTHAELKKEKGLYAKLAELQLDVEG